MTQPDAALGHLLYSGRRAQARSLETVTTNILLQIPNLTFQTGNIIFQMNDLKAGPDEEERDKKEDGDEEDEGKKTGSPQGESAYLGDGAGNGIGHGALL